jgi:hypothetical protein
MKPVSTEENRLTSEKGGKLSVQLKNLPEHYFWAKKICSFLMLFSRMQETGSIPWSSTLIPQRMLCMFYIFV